jgi:hypothetical protein
MNLRAPSEQALEWRERTATARSAARKGKSAEEIAELHQLPLADVVRILAPVEHPRISDPSRLLQNHHQLPGRAPVDVQLYWLGFLMAAGYIRGQGRSHLTLVVTLGKESREYIETFVADIITDRTYCEFCHSSIVGWQVYLRDQDLCKALFPWGIPSDLHGDDSALLDDLPKQLGIPFISGYVDGNWPAIHSLNKPRDDRFMVHGTPAVLRRINSMVQRYWGISSGVVIPQQERAKLQFSDPEACRIIHSQLKCLRPQISHLKRSATSS